MSSAPTRAWLAYGAAVWSLIFAVLHIIWAMGWYVGLEPQMARKAFQQTWFLVYDLVIAGMCTFGVFLGLALIQPWGRRFPRWLIGSVGWCAVGLLLLRSGGSMIQVIYQLIIGRGRNILQLMFVWELWFYLGAFLFTLGFWKFWRVISPPAIGRSPDRL